MPSPKTAQLPLHEEFLLLCLHDRKGTLVSSMSRIGIAAALLAELLLREHVRVELPRRRKMIEAQGSRWEDDPLLRECVEKIRTAKRRAVPQTWISRFSGISKLHHRVATPLCARGILQVEESKLLMVFKRKLYPERDPVPEREIVDRLRAAILSDGEVDLRTAILVSLANITGLLNPILGRKLVKSRKQRIRDLAKEEMVAAATREAIAAVQATMIAAQAAATAAAVASSAGR